MKVYIKRQCHVCGKQISTSGLPWVSHMRKHVRQGILCEYIDHIPYKDKHGRQSFRTVQRFERVKNN